MILKITDLSKTFIRPLTRQSFAQAMSPRKHKRMHVAALHSFSASLQKGEVATINAANGKGKTTLLKIIAGLYAPSSGTYQVNGSIMPLLIACPAMYSALEVDKNVIHFLRLYGLSKKDALFACQTILASLGLENKTDYFLFQLSRGQLCALTLLCGLYIPSDLYLIDELLDPLDQHYRRIVLEQLNKVLQKGSAAVVVSHNQELIQSLNARSWDL